MRLLVNNVRIYLQQEVDLLTALSRKLKVGTDAVSNLVTVHRAVDARRKDNICLNYHVQCDVDLPNRIVARLLKEKDIAPVREVKLQLPVFGREKLLGPVVIIGAGPAGLFAALELAMYGYKPLLLERGKRVEERLLDVERFWRGGDFNPDSNCQFGEGGAGTFSDGKLTTRVNDPVMHYILEKFVECGAPGVILSEHKPHIGSDLLRNVVTNMTQKICSLGGTVRYDSKVVDLVTDGGRITGVVLNNGNKLAAGAVVMACGHSARDTYSMLYGHCVAMETKNFAIGLRIEHHQEMIDKAQYGKFAGHHLLGVADYMLVCSIPGVNRSCYSFCMCPGGQVVATASEAGGVVVNGMSNFARDSGIANSALVVNVTADDFGHNVLDGVAFQRHYETLAFLLGGGNYNAPAQSLGSFLHDRTPSLQGLVNPSYCPGVRAAKLSDCLPDYVTTTLRQAVRNFDSKISGYGDEGAILTGVETRTSAPLRIVRNRETYVSISHDLLYPCGEGAGYAGGIMSAALDGFHVSRAVMSRFSCL